MFEQMKKLVPEVDTVNECIYQNIFDTMFESYVESNKELLNIFYLIIGYDNNKKTYDNNDVDQSISYKIDVHNNINEKVTTNEILSNFGLIINVINSKKNTNSNYQKNNSDIKIKTNCLNNKDKNDFDEKYFEYIIQKVYFQISETSKIDEKQFIVLRCSALRFLCNKYYIIHKKEWIENTKNEYIRNYLKILNQD